MSELIEKLVGYEKAKNCLNTKTARSCVIRVLRFALLEYRRKNNVFEVGDKVVHPKFNDTRIYEVREMKNSLILVYFDRLSYSFRDDIRHATDEEIKQGRRL